MTLREEQKLEENWRVISKETGLTTDVRVSVIARNLTVTTHSGRLNLFVGRFVSTLGRRVTIEC